LTNVFEAVNYILQYHDDGNEEFLVTLIKYREVFNFIETLKMNSEEVELKKEDSAENLEEEKTDKLV
jgi:hypothetical protein